MLRQQKRLRTSTRERRPWLYRPWLNVLGKTGYSTLTRSSDKAISQLVLFSLFCVLVPFFILLLVFGLPTVLATLNINLDDNFILNNLISFGLPCASLLVSFEIIKEVIQEEIKALENELGADHEEMENLKNRNQELEKSSDSNLRQEQHKYYLARAYVADQEMINQVRLDVLSSPTHKIPYKNLQDAKNHLKSIYSNREDRRKLRSAITRVNKKSWIMLASSAAMYALEIEEGDEAQLSNDPVKYRLFLDLYLYLNAWLVSSIDNDAAIAIPYMPVEDINLHYPTEDTPEINVYERAFEFLIKVFNKGLYAKLISESQIVTQDDIEACKKVSIYLNELIIRLNYFHQEKHTP